MPTGSVGRIGRTFICLSLFVLLAAGLAALNGPVYCLAKFFHYRVTLVDLWLRCVWSECGLHRLDQTSLARGGFVLAVPDGILFWIHYWIVAGVLHGVPCYVAMVAVCGSGSRRYVARVCRSALRWSLLYSTGLVLAYGVHFAVCRPSFYVYSCAVLNWPGRDAQDALLWLLRDAVVWMPLVSLCALGHVSQWTVTTRNVHCCVQCGYNLTGNVSGRCPECGAACTCARERVDAWG
ncbi:MAG: hypothetical protein CHACPFDD_00356 [Phycisphaerae bacterium]|nr:hypothetical protein [Phycisphaerae bacterium]